MSLDRLDELKAQQKKWGAQLVARRLI